VYIDRINKVFEGRDSLAVALLIAELKREGTFHEEFDGETLLGAAVVCRNADALRMLIEEGADIDVSAQRMLYNLGLHPDKEFEKTLIASGFDASRYPLPASILQFGTVNHILHLVHLGVNLNEKVHYTNGEYSYPLHIALESNNYSIVYAILHCGADPNTKDSKGNRIWDVKCHPAMLIPVKQFLLSQNKDRCKDVESTDASLSPDTLVHNSFLNVRRNPQQIEHITKLFETCLQVCSNTNIASSSRKLALDVANVASQYVFDVGRGYPKAVGDFYKEIVSVDIKNNKDKYATYYEYLLNSGYHSATEDLLLLDLQRLVGFYRVFGW